jgi:4-hydroxy-2-oxoheptanedioate aldolase
MPEMQTNAFKRAIAQGKLQIGLWSSLCSNIAAEVISDSGFDWILLDTEHSPNEIPDLVTQLQAIQRGTATPIIRPAWNDAVMAKRALDIGAQSLLFPYVQNVEEAKRAVASTRYPPQGIRGVSVAARASRYGRVPGYLTKANDEICVLVQVETRTALDQLEAIAKVEGIDGVFIGPSDLAASLGHLGNPQHADVQNAMQDAVKRLKALKKPAGILTGNEEEARRYIDWGYLFVAVGADVGLLARNADALQRNLKASSSRSAPFCARSKLRSLPADN